MIPAPQQMEGPAMKTLLRPAVALLLLAGLGLSGLACDDGRDVVIVDDGFYELATIENQSPDAIVVEPFGDFLYPGEAVDYDLGYDAVHIIVVRDFDGLVLLETDLVAGDVWIIQ
jgi:hypothetical protein